MCFGMNEERKNKIRQNIRENFHGAGERFIDDVLAIFEKYGNDSYVDGRFDEDLVSETFLTDFFFANSFHFIVTNLLILLILDDILS